MDLAGSFEFLCSTSPLWIGQLLIPPLSYFSGLERSELFNALYELTPSEYLSLWNVQALTFDPKEVTNPKKFYTWISYMFVHGDYSHLINNLQGFLLCGHSVHQDLGHVWFYSIFLGSGVAAMYPSPLRKMQLENRSNFIQRWFGHLIPRRYCGSSGGVFGLVGAGLTIKFLNLSSLFYQSYRRTKFRRQDDIRNRRAVSISTDASKIVVDFLSQPGVIQIVVSVVSTVLFISREYELELKGTSINTDHVGHIQGFVFGAGLALVPKLISLLPDYRLPPTATIALPVLALVYQIAFV
jgi:membrane associated rhomboid family serine protease